jgi:hypothetical protein
MSPSHTHYLLLLFLSLSAPKFKKVKKTEECSAPPAYTLKSYKEYPQLAAAYSKIGESLLTDELLMLFLRAKQFKMKASLELLSEAMRWRLMRNLDNRETEPEWWTPFSNESEVGKIYNPCFDRWGRPIVIFDSGVQNTNEMNGQMNFLSWSLNLAVREMPTHVDKYVVFMNLERFSFLTCPGLSATKETIHMLCNCFPERLGHCIAYRPPGIFKLFFDSVKGFIDPKTRNKMLIISDGSPGTKEDKLLRGILG